MTRRFLCLLALLAAGSLTPAYAGLCDNNLIEFSRGSYGETLILDAEVIKYLFDRLNGVFSFYVWDFKQENKGYSLTSTTRPAGSSRIT